jgi:hypothetical protein
LQVDRDRQAAEALCGDPVEVEVEVVTVVSPVEWSRGMVRASLEGGGLFGQLLESAVRRGEELALHDGK